MSRFLSVSALAACALLGLTACSGGEEEAAPAPSSAAAPSSSASSAPDSAPSASSSAAPTGSGSEELTAVLETVSAPDGTPLTVVPADQLDSVMQQGLQALEGVTVTPAECDALLDNAMNTPEGAKYAVGIALAPDGLSTTSVTIVELDGAEDEVRTRQAEAQALAETCSTYRIEAQGQTVTAESAQVETVNDGAVSQGATGVITLPTGQKQNTTTVSAARGSISVTAMSQTVDSPSAEVSVLEDLVDQVLAAADQE
jgi:hypothetical protein